MTKTFLTFFLNQSYLMAPYGVRLQPKLFHFNLLVLITNYTNLNYRLGLEIILKFSTNA
jgi:hypothetical protein